MSDATSETQGSRTFDAVSVLTFFIFCLIAIPSRLIVGPLGSAGTPAEIIGMGLLGGWCLLVVLAMGKPRQRSWGQSVQILMGLFSLAILFSYIAANLRPMMAAEARGADSGIFLLCSWLGIVFMTMDGVRSRARLDVLLRRLVVGGGALASLGVLQFSTKQAYTNYIQIPGLSVNGTLVSLYGRDDLSRPAGTAVHPIEFGAVLTMILPIALHFAIQRDGRGWLRRWYPVIAIAIAIPISISRSAIVSTVVVLCVIVPTWDARRRRRGMVAIFGLVGFVYLLVPGLLGTISSLFTGISQDSSTQSRTGSLTLAFEFVRRAPFFGRGFSTFSPAYRILDDQYLGLLIEVGAVGLVTFLALLVGGVLKGIRIRQRAVPPVDRSLAISLSASVASALASFGIFDAFGFPMASGLIFLVLGCVGALGRLYRAADDVAAMSPVGDIAQEPRRAGRRPVEFLE